MEFLTVLLLSTISAVGFVVSWERTMLKTHILKWVNPAVGQATIKEVDAWLYSKGQVGQLLMCPYCLGSQLSFWLFILFCIFSYFDVLFLGYGITALFGSSTLLAISLRSNTPKTKDKVEIVNEEPPKQDGTSVSEVVKAKLAWINTNQISHREFVSKNKDLFHILADPSKHCDFPGCQEIVRAYYDELRALENQEEECPSCVKGTIINKYLYTLDETRRRNT